MVLIKPGSDEKACHVAMFIHSPLLSPRQEGRMNENRRVLYVTLMDMTRFHVSRLNKALINNFCVQYMSY